MNLNEKNHRFPYSYIFCFLVSLSICYGVTVLGVLLLAFLLLTFHIPIELTDKILYGIYGAAVFCGVFFMEKMKEPGLRFQGLILGFLYCMILLILSRLLNKEFSLWQVEHGYVLLTAACIGEIAELLLGKRKGRRKNSPFY